MTPGPIALVGSGEYLPIMQDVEAKLIAGRNPKYVQIPTAAAPEGESSLHHWITLGKAQADRIGVEAVSIIAMIAMMQMIQDWPIKLKVLA